MKKTFIKRCLNSQITYVLQTFLLLYLWCSWNWNPYFGSFRQFNDPKDVSCDSIYSWDPPIYTTLYRPSRTLIGFLKLLPKLQLRVDQPTCKSTIPCGTVKWANSITSVRFYGGSRRRGLYTHDLSLLTSLSVLARYFSLWKAETYKFESEVNRTFSHWVVKNVLCSFIDFSSSEYHCTKK